MSTESMSFRTWLRVNWLPILLIALVFIVELILGFGYGLGRDEFIYWWVLELRYYQSTVNLVCVIGLVVTLLLRHVRWYVRVIVVLPFLFLLPISFFQGIFWHYPTSPMHISSVTFHDHVYHLSYSPAPPTDLSGPAYDGFDIYECDDIGLWCHFKDSVAFWYVPDFKNSGPHSVVLVVDDTRDRLMTVATGLRDGPPRIIQEYVFTTQLEPVATPAAPQP